eukprot:4414735-Prymnesium_polylepis.1
MRGTSGSGGRTVHSLMDLPYQVLRTTRHVSSVLEDVATSQERSSSSSVARIGCMFLEKSEARCCMSWDGGVATGERGWP